MIRELPIVIAFGVVLLHDAFTTSFAYERNTDRFPLDYAIGNTTFDVNITEINLSNRMKNVSNSIGSTVEAGKVYVELRHSGCWITKNNTGLEIEVNHTSYISSPLTYDIEINPNLIATSPGGFVSFDDDSNFSNGTIDFCIKVIASDGQLTRRMHFTEFNLPFDFDNDTITLTDVNFTNKGMNGWLLLVDMYGTDETWNEVRACQCDRRFTCYGTTPPTIEQGGKLDICLFPLEYGVVSESLRISNFNVILSTSTIIYQPVFYGTESPSLDDLTDIAEQDGIVRVSMQVVAQFFIEMHRFIDVGGNAFLEFNKSEDGSPSFESYSLQVGLGDTRHPGRLVYLLERFFFLCKKEKNNSS